MDGLWQEYIFVCNLTGCEKLLNLDILVMKVEDITSYIYFNFKILLSPSPFSFISLFILSLILVVPDLLLQLIFLSKSSIKILKHVYSRFSFLLTVSYWQHNSYLHNFICWMRLYGKLLNLRYLFGLCNKKIDLSFEWIFLIHW